MDPTSNPTICGELRAEPWGDECARMIIALPALTFQRTACMSVVDGIKTQDPGTSALIASH